MAAALAVPLPACAAPAVFGWFDYKGSDPSDRVPAKPGDYRNPILHGFYPDPSVTRAGRDFYLVNSTFAWFPGIPVWKSRDLVHWTQIGNAIDRPGQLDFKRLGLSRGVFAPAISWHAGTFYIVNTCVDCGGNFLVTAKNPAGPWSDPVWLPALEGGIDPSLFFDDDGSAWMVNNGPPPGQPLYEGHRAIWVQRFDPKSNKTFGPRTMLVNGGVDLSKKPVWIEGPHILRKGDYYYLTCAEGGTAEGHSQVVFRSRRPDGPFVPFAGNPILTQRDLSRGRPIPITSAGHAQLVDTPDGRWWATFLATRPYSGDFYNTGRETFLLPVTWQDGWPRITGPEEPIPYARPAPHLPPGPAPVPTSGGFAVRDDFRGPALPVYWMQMRNPRTRWWRLTGGTLSIQGRPVRLGDNANPSFLARRQQHMDATATTELRTCPAADGEEAGLAALQNDDFWYLLAVARSGGSTKLVLKRRAGPGEPAGGALVAETPFRCGGPVRLRVEAKGPAYSFSYAGADGVWRTLGAPQDGTMLSTKTAGGFVGAVFGLYDYAPR
ncbi:MAG TPA: glycoside hydrolase family 43 protein [Allosphingosinicella sp.]|jgi:alpha-N-arabinofuranosidase